MPPIPPRPTNFSDPDVVNAIASLQQREAFLGSTVIPHLATLPPTTTLLEQQRLAEDLREDLEDFGKRVEALEQLVEDLHTEKERIAGREVVQQWANTFAQMKRDARTAIISSKQAIDHHAKSRRDELLGSAVFTQEKREDEKTEDALMRTTASLTDALRRTEARLKTELDRSMLSTQLLTSQTATLKQTSNAHGQLSSLLDTSKNLVTALEKTDWLDRLLILGALTVFLLTCAWIIKVRVFDRMIRLTFWWVKWLPSLKSDRILDELERGAKAVTSSAQSAISTTIATLTEKTSSTASHLTTAIATSTPTIPVQDTITEVLLENHPSLMDAISTATESLSDSTQSIVSASTETATKIASVLREEL